MRSTWFHYNLVAQVNTGGSSSNASPPQYVVARVAGGDPGYESTAQMLAEAGMLLALKKAQLPTAIIGGGFLTPATAFGLHLSDALTAAGLSFRIVSWGVGSEDETNALQATGRTSSSWLDEEGKK